MPSVEAARQQYLDFIAKGNNKLDPKEVGEVYDSLKPIKPDFLIGSWEGGELNTGHVSNGQLVTLGWVGKDFRSVDDVDPIMIAKDGGRVFSEDWGHATLKEIIFRGVLSTCMVYDKHPIFDHFRYVSEDVVAGAMDAKGVPAEAGIFYFYLTRRHT